jgi:outer membrane lipoprotein-sorting protein
MHKALVLSLGLVFALTGNAWAQSTLSAESIIEKVDALRNPAEPFRATTTLTEYINGKPRDQDILTLFAKMDPSTKQYRDIVRYVQPPRDAGKSVLLDSHILWFYDPSSNSSVRISPQQQLLGKASIADVLTVNLALDYSSKIVAVEDTKDADRHVVHCWHLDLHASNDRASYDRIELWVEQGTFHPIKGRFYADSGRLMKILYYRNYQPVLGSVRPIEAIVIDAVDTSLVTTVTTSDYRAQSIPDAWFQRAYLPKLPAQ